MSDTIKPTDAKPGMPKDAQASLVSKKKAVFGKQLTLEALAENILSSKYAEVKETLDKPAPKRPEEKFTPATKTKEKEFFSPDDSILLKSLKPTVDASENSDLSYGFGKIIDWGDIDIHEFIDKFMHIIKVALAIDLFPYQVEFVERVFESVLLNDGDEITILISRQAGKSEGIACVCTVLAIMMPILAQHFPQLHQYKNGFYIGLFAPSTEQSETLADKIRMRLALDTMKAFLDDPEIGVTHKDLEFSNGSVIRVHSAANQSKIESKTYHLIIPDECQDIADDKILKSIHPMGASTSATIVKIGTPHDRHCEFYDAIMRNKRLELSSRGKMKNHFEFDHRVVSKYNARYRKYIEKEKLRLGEDSDYFRMSYCVAPETKILTADLRWVRADSILAGDKVVGFDEHNPDFNSQRRYRESVVEDVGIIERPCYRLTFEDGTSVVCSSEHKWLVTTAGKRNEWKEAQDIVFTDRVYKLCDVWEPIDDYRTGYLAAAFDGEGCLTQLGGKINQITFTQKNNEMLSTVKQYLTELGFNFGVKEGNNHVPTLYLTGGKYELIRFLGLIRPHRLLPKLSVDGLGTLKMQKVGRSYIHPRLVDKQFIGVTKVIPIRTSTRTYVAEGLASHNCLEWLLSQGMFITSSDFDKIKDVSLRYETQGDNKHIYVAGLDLAKKFDSTVLTIGKLTRNTAMLDRINKLGDDSFTESDGYCKNVVNWIEYEGDNWDAQVDAIAMELKMYPNLLGIAVDSTGVGDPIVDFLTRKFISRDIVIIPINFNLNMKHALAQLFYRDLQYNNIKVASHAKVRDSRRWKKFYQQMLEAEKKWKNGKMVITHPQSRGAKDDYVQSIMLMLKAAEYIINTGDMVLETSARDLVTDDFYDIDGQLQEIDITEIKGFDNIRRRAREGRLNTVASFGGEK